MVSGGMDAPVLLICYMFLLLILNEFHIAPWFSKESCLCRYFSSFL